MSTHGVVSKSGVELAYDARADGATAAVLLALLETIEANLEGAIADVDIEMLHDFRVAVRRSRAVQRELKRVFPPEPLARFRSEFRSLQLATGEARDLDVHVDEFESLRTIVPEETRGDLDPLLTVLGSRRLIARRTMARALRSRRTAALLSEWSAFLGELPSLPEDDRPDAGSPIGAVAGRRIVRVYRRIVRMGRSIGPSSPAEPYHELRKQGKELRYLLELFAAPMYPREVVGPMIKALKALQDVLGRHQDREVQIAMLHRLADDVADLPGGPDALMAMGVLAERLAEDQLEARSEFTERFDVFASKHQRALVRKTFA